MAQGQCSKLTHIIGCKFTPKLEEWHTETEKKATEVSTTSFINFWRKVGLSGFCTSFRLITMCKHISAEPTDFGQLYIYNTTQQGG